MTTSTMTALMPTKDRSWSRQEVPVPQAGPGELLLGSRFVAVNNADVLGMDRSDDVDDTIVAGYEVAGEVVAVGEGVDPALVGTLRAACTPASFAELVVADLRHTLEVPDRLPLEQAAALPTALLTEWGALQAGGFTAGQSVLVTGATSSIGLVGVQVARALGTAAVLATTRSDAKAELLHRVGADQVFISDDRLADRVRAATDGEGVDLVLEHVAGPVLGQAVAATRRHGTVVQMGRLGGPSAEIDVDALSFGRVTLIGVSFGLPEELASLLDGVREHVMPHVTDGAVRPVVHDVLPLDRFREAIDLVRAGRARGKVVLAF